MKSIRLLLAAVLAGSALAADPMAPVKPADYEMPVKVACIGDSITQGSGAAAGKSYPSQLQEMLGEQWKVFNFGVSGRTLLKKGDYPYWNEKAYRDALKSAPDVVIINYEILDRHVAWLGALGFRGMVVDEAR